MKRFLTVIVLLALIFGGVGYGMGWFHYDAQAKSFSFSNKFYGDFGKLKDKTKSLAKAAVDKVKSIGKKVDDTTREVDATVVSVNSDDQVVTLAIEGSDNLELPYLAGEAEIKALEGKMATVTIVTGDDGSVLKDIAAK